MKAFHTLDEKARVHGDVAVVTGRLRVEGVAAGGQAYDAEVLFTDILARIDGQWRAVAAHASKAKEPLGHRHLVRSAARGRTPR